MIVGLHNFVDAVGRYKDEVFSTNGGLSIVMMDGLLLIPVIMAAFFYPVVALELLVAMVAISAIGNATASRHTTAPAPHSASAIR